MVTPDKLISFGWSVNPDYTDYKCRPETEREKTRNKKGLRSKNRKKSMLQFNV